MRLVALDNASSGVFFTSSSSDGTDLFHGDDDAILVEVGDVMGLATRGFLRITELRENSDVAFAVTQAGHAYAEAIERGGLSEADQERQRADDTEVAFRDFRSAVQAAQVARDERRSALAMNLAWLPALGLAVGLSIAVYAVSQSGPLVGLVAFVGILGGSASQVVPSVRRRIAARVVRALTFIHDRA